MVTATPSVTWDEVSQGLLGLIGPYSTSRTVLRRYYTLISGEAPERRCNLRGSRCVLVGVCFAAGLVALVGHFRAHHPLGVAKLRPLGASEEADAVESLSENIHIQSHRSGKCLDWSDQIVMAQDCDTSKEKQKWTYVNQMIEVPFGRCMDDGGDAIHIWPCTTGGLSAANQHWRFDPLTGLLQDGELLESHCLQLDMPDSPLVSSVSMQPCDEDNEQQKWTFNAGPMVLTVPPTTTTTLVKAPKTSTASSTAPWTKPWQSSTTKKNTTTVPTQFMPVSTESTAATTGEETTTLSETTALPKTATIAEGETTSTVSPVENASITTESTKANASTEKTTEASETTLAEALTTTQSPLAASTSANTQNSSIGVNATSAASTLSTSEEETTTVSTSLTGTSEGASSLVHENSSTLAAAESTNSNSAALGSTSTEPRTSAAKAEGATTPKSKEIPLLVGSTTEETASPTTPEEQTTTVATTVTTVTTTVTTVTTTATTVTTTTTITSTTTTTPRFSESGTRAWKITKDGGCLLAGNHTAYMGPCTVNGTEEQQSTWIQTDTGMLISKGKCLEDGESDGERHLLLRACQVDKDGQKWFWEDSNNSNGTNGTNITHVHSGETNCLASDWSNESGHKIKVALEPCSEGATQQWDVVPTELPIKEIPPANILFGFLMTLGIVFCVVLVFGLLVPCTKVKKKGKPTTDESARTVDLSQDSPPMAAPAELPPQNLGFEFQPKPRQVLFADPRPNAYHEIGICGFSDRLPQGTYDVLDDLCGCAFLSNSFPADLELDVNGQAMRFTNAEAAFQALRLSRHAYNFQDVSGDEALQIALQMDRGYEDPEHGGYGTSWKAMQAVLKAKFKVNTPLGIALEKTDDDFLLCHSSGYDPNAMVWSNGANGEGTNWLGMQLMLIRSNRTGWKRWTAFIQSQVDTLTGRPLYNCRDNHFQVAVKRATEAVKAQINEVQAGIRDRDHPDTYQFQSMSQQPATFAGALAADGSGPAGQQREMMLGIGGVAAGQQRDVLTGYDPHPYDDYQAVCQACQGTGTDFMGHPCVCGEEARWQHQQQVDFLQQQADQYPPDWGDDALLNGATLNGAAPGQDYRQPVSGQPGGSSGARYADLGY